MKLIVCILLFYATVSFAQQECNPALQNYTKCVSDHIQKGKCDSASWCTPCTAKYEDYANCTCNSQIGMWKPQCVPQCATYQTCNAEAGYNPLQDCTNQYVAYQQCLASGKARPSAPHARPKMHKEFIRKRISKQKKLKRRMVNN